jgi:hypothetical protein
MAALAREKGVAGKPGHALSGLIDGRALTVGQDENARLPCGFRCATKKAIIRASMGFARGARMKD